MAYATSEALDGHAYHRYLEAGSPTEAMPSQAEVYCRQVEPGTCQEVLRGLCRIIKHILMQAKAAAERLHCDTEYHIEDKVCLWPLQRISRITSAIGLPIL